MSVRLRPATVPASAVPYPTALYPPFMRVPQFVPPATIITQFQSGHGWTGSSGFTANDTSDFVMGSQSAKQPTGGAGGTFTMTKTGLSIDTTGKYFRLRVKVDNVAFIGSGGFIFEIANESGFTNTYKWTIQATAVSSNLITEGEWITVTLGFADAVTTGSPTRTGIAAMRLRISDTAAGTAVTLHAQSVEMLPDPSAFANGVLSFCADDIWSSWYTLGKPILEAAGLRGDIFVIGDQIGTGGKMTQAQLLAMQEQGWPIGGHALTDSDHSLTYTGMTAAQLDADLRGQHGMLIDAGFESAVTAYPLGQYGKTTDNVSTSLIARRYFAAGRTTVSKTMETFPAGDLYRLRAVSGISSAAGGHTAAAVTATTTGDIDRAVANKQWLILCFHKVVASGVAATTEILSSDLQSIVDKAVSSGIAIRPIADVLRSYG